MLLRLNHLPRGVGLAAFWGGALLGLVETQVWGQGVVFSRQDFQTAPAVSTVDAPAGYLPAEHLPSEHLPSEHLGVQAALDLQSVLALLQMGQKIAARDRMLPLLKAYPTHQEVRFVAAQVARANRDNQQATDLMRQMVAQEPNVLRLRLDLAQDLFSLGHDRKAREAFETALLMSPPPGVRRTIETYLDRLDQRAPLRAGLDLGVTPTSNVNQATRASIVNVLGIPFTLSKEAQAKPGWELKLDPWLSLTHRVPAKPYRFYLGLKGDLDAATEIERTILGLGITAGTVFEDKTGLSKQRVELSVEDMARFDRDGYMGHDQSLSLDLDLPLSPEVPVQKPNPKRRKTQAFRQNIGASVHRLNRASGNIKQVSLAYTAGLYADPMDLRLTVQSGRRWADDRNQAYRDRGLGLGLAFQAVDQLDQTMALSGHRFDYETPGLFGSVPRLDRTLDLSFGFSSPLVTLGGLRPEVSVGFTRRLSNQDLYTYSRFKGGLKFSREF